MDSVSDLIMKARLEEANVTLPPASVHTADFTHANHARIESIRTARRNVRHHSVRGLVSARLIAFGL